jgi:hypothetical protein
MNNIKQGNVRYRTDYYVKKAGSALGAETDSGKIINESDPTKKKSGSQENTGTTFYANK